MTSCEGDEVNQQRLGIMVKPSLKVDRSKVCACAVFGVNICWSLARKSLFMASQLALVGPSGLCIEATVALMLCSTDNSNSMNGSNDTPARPQK